jgi:hypothetical protein
MSEKILVVSSKKTWLRGVKNDLGEKNGITAVESHNIPAEFSGFEWILFQCEGMIEETEGTLQQLVAAGLPVLVMMNDKSEMAIRTAKAYGASEVVPTPFFVQTIQSRIDRFKENISARVE